MKEGLIIFLVGLLTITITMTILILNEEYKKTNKTKIEFVCKNGGMPDWNCFPDVT
jgi:hypothetical protein